MNDINTTRARLLGLPGNQPVTTEAGEVIDEMSLVRSRLLGEPPVSAPIPSHKDVGPASTREELERNEPDPDIAVIARRATPDEPLWVTAAKMEEARRQRAGQPVVGEGRLRMYDAFSRAYTGQKFDQRKSQEELKQGAAEDQGFLKNLLTAMVRTAAEGGANVVGVLNEDMANNLKTNIAEFYGAYDSKSVSGFAGELLGSMALLAPAVFNPTAAAGLLGASAVGGELADIQKLRDEGQEIGSAVAWTSAIAHGTAEFVFERAGLKAIGKASGLIAEKFAPSLFKAISGGQSAVIRPLINALLGAAGVNAGEEALTQIAQNAAKNLYQEQGLFEGVGRAAAMGGLMGGGLAAAGGALRASRLEGSGPASAPATAAIPTAEATEFTGPDATSPAPAAPAEGGPAPAAALPPELQEGFTPSADAEAELRAEAARDVAEVVRGSLEASLTAQQREAIAATAAAARATQEATDFVDPAKFRATDSEQAGGAAGRVSPRVQAAFDRFVASSQTTRPGVLVGPRSRDEADAARLAEELGVEIGFVTDAAYLGVSPEPGVVLVRSGDPIAAVRATVAHEVAHATGIDTRGLLDARQLRQYEAKYRQSLERAVASGKISQKVLDHYNSNATFRRAEATASMIGDVLADPAILARLRGENPGLARRIVLAVKRVIGRLTGVTQTTDRILAEFRAAMDEQRAAKRVEASRTRTWASPANAEQIAAFRTQDNTEGRTPEQRRTRAEEIDARIAELVGKQSRSRTKPYTEAIANLRQQRAAVLAAQMNRPAFRPDPSEEIRGQAAAYTKAAGVEYTPFEEYVPVNPQRAKAIARHYEQAQHEPDKPEVREAYDAFKRETLDQWKFLKKAGVKMEPWTKEGQPYPDSAAMMQDVRGNKHLFFFTGGDIPADHPLAERVPGENLTYNDVFRAVHDYFGHSKEGVGFGPRGEENAWIQHSRMFSETARRAMTTETRGQNSWVNFGPYGEANRANPANTVYAEQKATVLPERFMQVPGDEAKFLPDDSIPQNSWIDPEGNIYPMKDHRHSSIIDQLPEGHPAKAAVDIDDLFNTLYNAGWVRVQTHRGGMNVATNRLTPEAGRILSNWATLTIDKDRPLHIYSKGDTAGGRITDAKTLQRRLQGLSTAPVSFRPEPVDIIRQSPPDDPNFGERAKTLLNESLPSGPTFRVTHWDRVKKAWKDSEWPLMKAFNTATSRAAAVGAPVAPGDNPALLLRTLGGWDRTIDGRMNRGLRTAGGQRVVDPKTKQSLTVDWLLGGLDHANEAALLKDLNAAMSLGVAERTLEKAAQTGKDDGITGFKRGRPEPTDREAAEAYIREYKTDAAAYDRATETLRRYRLFADQTLKYAVDTGWLDAAAAATIKADNQYYINLQRVMEERSGQQLDSTGVGKLYKFKGSDRTIDNPLVNLLATTEGLQKAANHNRVLASFVKAAEATKSTDLAERVPVQSTATIKVRLAGKDTFWKVDPEVKEIIDAYNEYFPEFLPLSSLPVIGALIPESIGSTGILNIPGKSARAGISNAPPFIIRNAFRSSLERAIKSDTTQLWDEFNAFTDADVAEFEEFGGSVGRREYGPKRRDYYDRMKGHVAKLAGDKNTILGIPGKAWDGWKSFGDAVENRTRMVEFTKQRAKAKAAGMSDYDASVFAAAKARELVDFAVSGSAIRAINRIMYIPFLNAAIQGLGSDIAAARKNPKTLVPKLMMYSVAPSLLAYWWASSQGEEEKKEYLNLPAWRRDFFWNFKVGQMYVSMPKPFLFGAVGSGVERVVSVANGNDEDMAGYLRSLVRASVPVDEGIVAGPFQTLIENMTNYSFFFDRHIVPPWEENLALDLRKTDSASSLGKWLSKAVAAAGWEVDPRKWDNFLTGYGGTGQLAMAVSDIGSGKPGSGAADVARRAVGITALPPGGGSVVIRSVLETASRLGDDRSVTLQPLKDLLDQSYKAGSLEERNALVSKARDEAARIEEFYDRHEESLMRYQEAKRGAETPAEVSRFEAVAERLLAARKRLSRAAVGTEQRARIHTEIDRILQSALDIR